MTKEELAEVERLVNEAIESHTPITCEEMTVAQAKEQALSACLSPSMARR